MKVLTWNVNGIRGIDTDRLRRISESIATEAPDIVTLQEISAQYDLWPQVRDGLKKRGYTHAAFSGPSDATEKRYGNVIASRFPVEFDRSEWAPGVPWQQLLARATVEVPDIGRVEVITAHIPNGSGNGWKKVYTFEALAAYLESAEDVPRILTGDFNEPDRLDDGGKMLSFGQTLNAASPTLDGDLAWSNDDDLVESYPRKRWHDAVAGVLDGPHLRNTKFERKERSLITTYVTTNGAERSFDHILVSEHFDVAEVGYEHQWREDGDSDHSAAWAELKPRP